MMLLDTNIISEMWRPKPATSVVEWLDAQASAKLYICTPVLAEIRSGLERLAEGPRRDFLSRMFDHLITAGYRGRVLDFDVASAIHFGRIIAIRERAGRRVEIIDAMIAGIALANGMTLVTRNTSDFAGIGLDLIDPFTAPFP